MARVRDLSGNGGRFGMGFADPDIAIIQDLVAEQGLNSTSLDRWRAAVARVRAGTGRGRVLCLGDSTTSGVGATDATGRIAQSYPAVMATVLASLGIATSFKSFMGNASQATGVLATFDPRMVIGAGWAADAQEKPGGQGLLNSTNANTFEFTPVGNIDSFELYALNNTGQGTIGWSVDAGAATNISLNFGPEAMYKSATLSAGAAGTHTLKITRVSGSAYIHGFVAWDSTVPAIDVICAGRGSGTSTTLTTSNRGWSPLQNIATIAPDLVILNIGINDYTPASIVEINTFAANLRTLLNTYTAFADVILVVPTPSDVTRQIISIQEDYSNVIRRIGVEYGINVVDLRNRWTSYTEANARGYFFDIVHPTRVGYADTGEFMARLLANV